MVCCSGLKVTAFGNCAEGFDCVSGQRTADAEKGVVVFDSIKVNTPPGNFSISLLSEDLDHVTKGFSIRDCVPGEFNVTSQNICDHCGDSQYSFLPTVPCRDCAAKGFCDGGAALVPIDNYWHSSPFSTQFHQCLVAEACAFEVESEDENGTMVQRKRRDILTGFYEGLTLEEVRHARDTGRVFTNEEYQQCRKVSMLLKFRFCSTNSCNCVNICH